MGFAENLRYLRKKKRYSQEFIANKLGYKSYTTVQKWETNNAEPSLEKLHELADLFDTSMNMLVNGEIIDNELVLTLKRQIFANGENDELVKLLDEDVVEKYGEKGSTKRIPVAKYTPTHQRVIEKIGLLGEAELIFVESIIDSYLEKKNK